VQAIVGCDERCQSYQEPLYSSFAAGKDLSNDKRIRVFPEARPVEGKKMQQKDKKKGVKRTRK